jgi:hypothetical protein
MNHMETDCLQSDSLMRLQAACYEHGIHDRNFLIAGRLSAYRKFYESRAREFQVHCPNEYYRYKITGFEMHCDDHNHV